MSNKEIIENTYKFFASGNIPGLIENFDSNIEWSEANVPSHGKTFKGVTAILENVFMKLGNEWQDFRAVPDEFLDGGEEIVALGKYSGIYKKTGKSINVPFAHVWSLNDGKILKFIQFTDTKIVAGIMSETDTLNQSIG